MNTTEERYKELLTSALTRLHSARWDIWSLSDDFIEATEDWELMDKYEPEIFFNLAKQIDEIVVGADEAFNLAKETITELLGELK